MSDGRESLRASSLMMKITGWGIIVGLERWYCVSARIFVGINPPGFPFICWQHPPSPYDGLHPYVFMVVALYFAWAVLMIRGADDPRANAALFDFGILANLLHAGIMIPQAFIYPTKRAPMGGCSRAIRVGAACWYWYPSRVASEILSA